MKIQKFIQSNMNHFRKLATETPELLDSHRSGEVWGPCQFGWDIRLELEPVSARRRRWLAKLEYFDTLLEWHGPECSATCNYFWMEGRTDKCSVHREIAEEFKNHAAYRSEWTLKDDAEEQADYYRHVLKTLTDFLDRHAVAA